MFKSTEETRAEFDEIALRYERFGGEGGGRRGAHMPIKAFLAGRLPAQGSSALEIGCGLGSFTAILAERFEKVTALDLSPEMARMARKNTSEFTNIEFIVADVNAWDFPLHQFDCIVSITTLHHMPLEPVLKKMRDSLRPGGLLLVGDFCEPVGFKKLEKGLRAGLRSWRRKRRGRQEIWATAEYQCGHDPNERYLTLKEARRVCASVLPGAVVTEHPNTYSIEWKKP